MFRNGGAVEFVAELSRRWEELHPNETGPRLAADPMPAEMPDGAVFISYAHEDLASARTLRRDLRTAGIDVWFDEAALYSGDRFDHKIVSYIKDKCCCFVALLSQSTEQRSKGYFRKEWAIAVEQLPYLAPTRTFFMPVIIDQTRPSAFRTLLPEMQQFTMSSLPGGKATPEFLERIKNVLAKLKN